MDIQAEDVRVGGVWQNALRLYLNIISIIHHSTICECDLREPNILISAILYIKGKTGAVLMLVDVSLCQKTGRQIAKVAFGV